MFGQCSWPHLHGNMVSINMNNTFRGISLKEDSTLSRVMRKRSLDQFLAKQSTNASTDLDSEIKKLKRLVKAISKKLNSEVFGDDEKKVISRMRQLCDI